MNHVLATGTRKAYGDKWYEILRLILVYTLCTRGNKKLWHAYEGPPYGGQGIRRLDLRFTIYDLIWGSRTRRTNSYATRLFNAVSPPHVQSCQHRSYQSCPTPPPRLCHKALLCEVAPHTHNA